MKKIETYLSHIYLRKREKRPSKKTNVCLDDAIDAKLHSTSDDDDDKKLTTYYYWYGTRDVNSYSPRLVIDFI